MDGLIAVCHFCEQHGPSVVFCTQAHQQLVSHELQALIGSRKGQSPYSSKPTTVAHGEQDATDGCAACMAFPVNKESCLVSHSEGTDVSYVSSRGPLNAQLTSLVKRACVRSLSCEVCPGGEGCVYFGDDVRGHVLSYTFSLRDVHARGLKRWYSILVVVRDQVYLLSAWTFLVNRLQLVVHQLQDRASQVFASEGGVTGRQKAELPRRHRVSSRGLQELVNFPNIWQRLHTAHVWLMLAVGERVLEVIGGTVASMMSQGAEHPSQGAEHQAQEAESNVADKNVSPRSSQRNSVVPEEFRSIMERSTDEPLSTRQLRSLLGAEQFELLLQTVLLGFPLVLRCHMSTACVLPSILRALKLLVPNFLHHLISVQAKSSASPSPALDNKASGTASNLCNENLNIFKSDLDVRLKNNDSESNTVADPITNVSNNRSTVTTAHEVCTSASNYNLEQPSTSGSYNLTGNEPALTHTRKSMSSLSTLTSSSSIEVYDALDMDTLVLDISYKQQQHVDGEDSNKNSSKSAHRDNSNGRNHPNNGSRNLLNNTSSQYSSPAEHQWNRQQQIANKRLSLEMLPALSSCSPAEVLQRCGFKLVYRCEAASPWQRRVCGAVRSITAACINSALRDDTLALTIQHTLQQWCNKAKLWDGLVKQHQSNSSSASTTGDISDVPPTATAVPTIFSTPLSLPSFLTGHKTKPQIQHVQQQQPPALSLPPPALPQVTSPQPQSTVPLCVEQRHEQQQQQQHQQQQQQVETSSLKRECASGARPTPLPPPSAEVVASGSSSLSVPRAVLQQMLLAVGATECDVPLLQCWACYSCAAQTC